MRGILFDLDGVLYNSEEAIDGSADVVNWVQSENIPHLFVTNTTSRGRTELVQKLKSFGIKAELDQILTPCVAAAEWLRARSDGPVRPVRKSQSIGGIPGTGASASRCRNGRSLRRDWRSGRRLGFPHIKPCVPAPAFQSRSHAYRSWHDALLACARRAPSGCSPFHRSS